MSRKIPNYQKDHYYHLYNRGANKEKIFFEEENYMFLLRRVRKYATKFSISIIAYCLMPNHYHFLARQDDRTKAGTFIQRVFNSYTKAVNNKYDRSGTLFEGPYRAIHVDNRNYLIHLCRYIHRNPLDAYLVEHIKDWPYSNYPEWMNLRSGTLYKPEFVKQHFKMPQAYREFIQEFKPSKKLEPYLFEH